MPDRESIALVLAGVTGTASIAFAVAGSLTVAYYVGVWPAITVAALLTASTGLMLLYAIGELDRDRNAERVR